jgi:hypothetical protein
METQQKQDVFLCRGMALVYDGRQSLPVEGATHAMEVQSSSL